MDEQKLLVCSRCGTEFPPDKDRPDYIHGHALCPVCRGGGKYDGKRPEDERYPVCVGCTKRTGIYCRDCFHK